MTKTLFIRTKPNFDCVNITRKVEEFVQEYLKEEACTTKHKRSSGSVLIFSKGSTATVTTIEYKEGVIKDLEKVLEKIAPKDEKYEHFNDWNDDNGFSHIRAALMKPSIVVPFCRATKSCDSLLQLGTWQQIVLINFDTRPREREVILQILH